MSPVRKLHMETTVQAMAVQDPLTDCEWCGHPLEKGDRAFFAENPHGDAVGCSPSCARATVHSRVRRHYR